MPTMDEISAGVVEFDPIVGLYYYTDTGEYISENTGVIDAATNQQNLNLAAAQAMEAAGLTRATRSSWQGFQLEDYITRLRAIIVSNPGSFTPETVAIAERISVERNDADRGKPINPQMIIVGFTDLIAPAVDAVSGISQIPSAVGAAGLALTHAVRKASESLINTATIAPVLIPLAAVALVYFLARSAATDAQRKFSFA